ncbi:acyl-CoA dehydrogenase family protein [Solirubrobacter taibaiensis]|nr:acyl-CoA dehydrogenase family protein [Solirubrobacter taibaiensis]
MLELTAKTEAGARLVALAETLAQELARRAPEHDREATFPHSGIDALKAAGYFTAPVPVVHGGMGVTSVHDTIVASGRLARGDASVAIGVNMHLVVLLNVVRRWQAALDGGDARRAAAFATFMEDLVRDEVVMAAAISEPGQDLTRPRTRAVRVDGGWRIDGRKAFCTMSPAATVLHTAVTFVDASGVERYGYAPVPPDAPGVTIHGDWDALGMRASGSHSVTFDSVVVPAGALRGGFVVGDANAYMERNLVAGLFHASASLGIAESAVSCSLRSVHLEPDARSRMLLAENAIELGAVRASLSRAATLVDEGEHELLALFAETQAAKAFVNDACARIVDRALALSGGAGYLTGSPLARAYRDVRAGSFMHPLGANRAYDLLGDVALGREPVLH